MALAWLAALAGSGASGPRRWWLGPAALALSQLGICGLTLYAKIWSGGGSS